MACGGGRPDRDGYFVLPTVLTGVRPGMAVFSEEIFGPVLSVTTFDDDDEAIRLANAVGYGLTASVWTTSLDRAHRFAASFEAGFGVSRAEPGPRARLDDLGRRPYRGGQRSEVT